MPPITLNGRTYRLPSRPTVVICVDGCDPAYIEAGLEAGVLPTVARWRKAGFYALAEAAMPTFSGKDIFSAAEMMSRARACAGDWEKLGVELATVGC